MKPLLFSWMLLLAAFTTQAAGVKIPPFERVQLPNGTTLVLMADHEVPLIAVEALVRGGADADPAQRSGTASVLAELLGKGAGKRDALQFAEAVDRVGGHLEAEAQREYISISGSFLARDGQLMVELLADMLQRPRLEAAEFEKLRARQIEFIRAAKDSNLQALVPLYADAALLPSHPYGRPVSGSEASLGRVTLADVQAFYRQQLGGDRLIISVAGDFDPKVVQQWLTKAFASWRAAAQPLAPVPAPTTTAASRVLLVDAPQSTQSYFWMGTVGVAKSDPRRAAIDAVNAVFGGRYMSLLNTELRIRSGLTYGARSRFDRFAQPGYWSISSFTRTETTAAAIDMAMDTLRRLHTKGLSDADLASGRAYVEGQFPLGLETAEDWAGALGMLELYALDRSYIEGYLDAIDHVDARSARAAIDAVFPKPEQLLLVVIGPAATIRSSLAKYGPITEMKLTDPEFAKPSHWPSH